MFKKLEGLDFASHGKLKFAPTGNYGFAAGQHLAPLSFSETAVVSKYYPIVFPEKEPFIPQALLALKQGENVYVDKEGKWTVPYIPAFIRRYPMTLAVMDDSKKYAVMIDREAPHFNETEGIDLFDAEGQVSPEIRKNIEFLDLMNREMTVTAALCKQLGEQGVLIPKKLELRKDDEKKFTVGGFQTVDTQKFAAVNPEVLAGWVKNGLMSVIYAHLFSLANIDKITGTVPA